MHLKILGLFVAVALIAACETAPEGSAGASGAGKTKDTSLTLRHTAKPAAGSQNDLLVNVGDRVFFDYDKYNVSSQARQILVKQAAWMKKYPALIFTIEGHCDERGTREYNLALGQRRAAAVKEYLVALGVDANRVATISYGKERAEVGGSNEAAWRQNRRGVTTVN